jgi:hypothetical protein
VYGNAGFAVALAACFGLGMARWRAGVIAAVVLAVFEGALRKWVFPEFGQWIYFAKDFLLLGAYVGFWGPKMVQHKRLLVSHPANGLLALLAVVVVLELGNPLLPNLGVGLFGVKAYLMYVPLMYLVPYVFRDVQVLRKYWAGYLILAFIPLLLGVGQFWSSPDSVLNRYAAEDELAPGVAVFGSMAKPRITGTFSYITGHATYLTLIVLMGLSWVVFERRRGVPRWLYGVLALAVANLLMTGSRGPFLVLGGAAVALFTLALPAGQGHERRAVRTACVALPLIGLLVSGLFPEARTAFLERARETEDLTERLVGIVSNPLWALAEAGAVGYGVGSTHQARVFLMPAEISDTLPPPAEGEWGRIILEIGPIGFALVLLTRIFVAVRLWRTFRAARGTQLQPYLAAALVFALVSIPSNLVFNHTASVFYWFLAGFGLLAGELVPRRVQAVTQPVVARHEYAS